MSETLSLVPAHSVPGLTDVCYTRDGSHFVTCGQDGDIHVFDAQTDEAEHIRCSDQCSCVAVHDYHLFVGTNRNELEVRSFPHGDALPSLAHFTQPVSALHLSNSQLFIGTRDFKVAMINLNDNSNTVKYFDGHQAPILALNAHSEKNWLATSSCDGHVRVFNTNNQTLIKQLNIINKSNDIETASSLVKLDWDTVDNVLAIPVKNCVHFYESDKWTRKGIYENEFIVELANLISYSPCRTLFIVAYVNGQVSIVDRIKLTVCISYSTKDAVCAVAWNPSAINRLTCCTMAGDYAHVDVSKFIKVETAPKKQTLVEKMTNDNEEEEEEDDSESLSNDTEQVTDDKEPLSHWMQHASAIGEMKPTVELQEPFQSTSTSKYLESRYLVWNNIGALTSYSDQIQVSFHDVSYHHSITIDNKTEKYTMGDLSLSAVLLASASTGKLLCLLYQSWDSNMREWSMNLDDKEKIEVIILAERLIAVGTSQRFVRLLTLSGIQQRVIRLQGPLVSLAAHRDQLWMIHHSTQGLPKEQAMSYVLLDTENDDYSSGPLPLTPKTKLIWIGFSDAGRCFYAEKSGQLTMLRRTRRDQLEPVYISNLKQEAEKNSVTRYWLLGINDCDGTLQLRVIELRGQSYPDLVPWPLVSMITVNMALCQIDSEKSQLESDYLKLKLFNQSNDEEQDANDERQCLIKMFALSCKSNREYRAFEICQWMDSTALQLAVKYATKSGKLTLAQRIIDELVEQKEEEKVSRPSRPRSPPLAIITSSKISTTFEDIPLTRTKTPPASGPFANPFRKKMAHGNDNSASDQLSKWKPSVNKSRLSSSNKAAVQPDASNEVTVENEEITPNGKRKMVEDEKDNEETSTNKRNKLRQFACNR